MFILQKWLAVLVGVTVDTVAVGAQAIAVPPIAHPITVAVACNRPVDVPQIVMAVAEDLVATILAVIVAVDMIHAGIVSIILVPAVVMIPATNVTITG